MSRPEEAQYLKWPSATTATARCICDGWPRVPGRTDIACPDCGTSPVAGSGYRRASSLPEALEMPEASCPNRRHDTWRSWWGLPPPCDNRGHERGAAPRADRDHPPGGGPDL